MINANAERIKNLTFNGKPIDPNAMFLVATNNYRAYGGKFAGTGDSHIAFASPDENARCWQRGLLMSRNVRGKFTRRQITTGV